MKLVELQRPKCGKLCQGEILNGYPDYLTTECKRDGFHTRKISWRQ